MDVLRPKARPGSSGRYNPRVKTKMSSSHSANFFKNINSQIKMLRSKSPTQPRPALADGERGGTGHIIMEYNPEKNRIGYFKEDKEIILQDSHFEPLFFANDIEEIRNNPDARKALRSYNIFSGQP